MCLAKVFPFQEGKKFIKVFTRIVQIFFTIKKRYVGWHRELWPLVQTYYKKHDFNLANLTSFLAKFCWKWWCISGALKIVKKAIRTNKIGHDKIGFWICKKLSATVENYHYLDSMLFNFATGKDFLMKLSGKYPHWISWKMGRKWLGMATISCPSHSFFNNGHKNLTNFACQQALVIENSECNFFYNLHCDGSVIFNKILPKKNSSNWWDWSQHFLLICHQQTFSNLVWFVPSKLEILTPHIWRNFFHKIPTFNLVCWAI